MKKIKYLGYKSLLSTYGGIENIPIDSLKSLSKDAIKNMSEKELEDFINYSVNYLERTGFPYPKENYNELMKQFSKLRKMDINTIYVKKTKEIKQHNIGTQPINAFHKHRFNVKCRSFSTPVEMFEKNLPKIVKKCIYFQKNPLVETEFRTISKIVSGVHLASNFRPSAVKFMIERYCPKNGKYLDPSMGYGGRMLGALATIKLSEYHCCDPCKETVNNNKKILSFLKNKMTNSGLNKFINHTENKLPTVKINNIPFEEYEHSNDYFDLVFTSPPYFNIEKYSDEDTQSWKKYSEYEDWKNNFLYVLLKKSYKLLKPGGYCAINIAGKVNAHDLEKDTIDIGKELFGGLHETIYLRLSKMLGTRNKGQGRNSRNDFKLEPIFVFKKEN